MRISVVIPTYNRASILERTIGAVLAQDLACGEYEVIVVDDGSRDGTRAALSVLSCRGPLRVLQQANRGQASARNTGIRAARGEIVVFLDDDIVCPPDLLSRHAAAHAGQAPMLAFGPVAVASDSPRRLSTLWTERYIAERLDRWCRDPRALWPDDITVNANSSVRTAALRACGGFDERLPHHRENAELGLRLHASGVRFQLLPEAKVQQLYVKSTEQVFEDALEFGRNELRLCRAHPHYRPHSALAPVGRGSPLRRLARRAVVHAPVGPLLAPTVRLADALSRLSPARATGIALFQACCGVRAYRAATREAGSWDALQREFGVLLPVLCYHHVGPRSRGLPAGLSVTPERFERQLDELARGGFTCIAPEDWFAWCLEGRPLPRRPLLLTFDDGYADLAEHALPVLERRRLPAVVFLVTARLGGTSEWDRDKPWPAQPLLSRAQVLSWAARGVRFGSHTRTHVSLPGLSAERLRQEVDGSAEDLRGLLGTPVTCFAYPYGDHDVAAVHAVASTYPLAFTVEPGRNGLSSDPGRLLRLEASGLDSPRELRRKVASGAVAAARLRNRIRSVWPRAASDDLRA